MALLSTDNVAFPVSQPGRLVSLDAMCGFDMFWIISGEDIFHGFASVIKNRYHLSQKY